MRQVGGTETQHSQDPNPQVGDPQIGSSQLQRFFPRSEESMPHIGLPSPGVLQLENKPPEHLTFKASGSVWESRRAVGNRLLLKDTHKISHTLSPSTEAVIWKEPGSDPLADLREPPGAAGGNWDSPQGHRCWQQPFGGACSTMRALC